MRPVFFRSPLTILSHKCTRRPRGVACVLGSIEGRTAMHYRKAIGAVALAAALGVTIGGARAFDEAQYPDLKGQWLRTDTGTPRYDPSKPAGRGQQAPLIPEYQAILEASLADQ